MNSIDNSMKTKLNNYNLVKGSLVQMQRKKLFAISLPSLLAADPTSSGNLSVRSLNDVVTKDDVIQDSEYLETILVAVSKYASP